MFYDIMHHGQVSQIPNYGYPLEAQPGQESVFGKALANGPFAQLYGDNSTRLALATMLRWKRSSLPLTRAVMPQALREFQL